MERSTTRAVQNRRMYRGKGFKDGNLPKPKNKKYAKKPAMNKYGDADVHVVAAADGDGQNGTTLVAVDVHIPQHEDNNTSKQLSSDSTSHSDMNKKVEQSNINSDGNSDTNENANQDKGDNYQAVMKEIKHLRKRILNIQESIQLSPSYAQPPIWKEKCLNAVRNCVNEWRNIVSYHGEKKTQAQTQVHASCNLISDDEDKSQGHGDVELKCELNEEYPMHPNNEWSKSTSLQVYGLVQMAMQSGPLKGSNPGYFKRCGVEVASMAKEFLIKCISSDKDGTCIEIGDVEKDLRFTVKQKESIEKWMRNADKAIASNKPPSKSALKLQATSKGDKKKRKKSKG